MGPLEWQPNRQNTEHTHRYQMNAVRLHQAFRNSDFDSDGYLNEFETNHFGYLLFGHKNHGALYSEMCSYCDSNPMFGLNFENILTLFPHINVDEDNDKKSKKQKKKHKHKKKSEK